MNRSLPFAVAACTLWATFTSQAQTQLGCGTDAVYNELKAARPEVADNEHGLEAFIRDYDQAVKSGMRMNDTTYVIPIVFHVLWSDADGRLMNAGLADKGMVANIPDENIWDQINILNEDYQKLNADTALVCCGFEDIIADVNLEFRLATKDPDGNCSNGIDRIRTVETYQGNDGSKLHPWYQGKYLNVWTCAKMRNGVAGYAYYPSAGTGPGVLADGIIILYDYIGSLPPSSGFNSRALTHEIGHWLNLQHTWGSTNDPTVACGDDDVEDTPITAGHDNCLNLKDFACDSEAADTVYTFSDVTAFSGTTDPTPAPLVYDTAFDEHGIVLTPFTATGVSSNPVDSDAFIFNSWDSGAPDSATLFTEMPNAINTGKYYEFTLTPTDGRAMSLTAITFKVKRDSLGCRTYAMKSSLNSFGASLTGTLSPTTTNLQLNMGNTVFFFTQDTVFNQLTNTRFNLPTAYTQLTQPVTFRIYAWNAEDLAGSFQIDDLRVFGTYGVMENVQNYMEYSYCSYMFTNDQGTRMRAALNNSLAQRSTLWTEANLAFTGTDGVNDLTCAPQAGFMQANKFACINSSVQFKARSGGTAADSWSWTFQDGSPATSTSETPNVQFTSGGWKSVSLTATNAYGSTTTTNTYAIKISEGYPDVPGLLSETFEAPNALDNWNVQNYEENQTSFQRVEGVGHTGNACVRLNAFNLIGPNDIFIDDGAGDIDELITPTLDFSLATNITMNFWYAYTTQTGSLPDMRERLDIYSSIDCGKTWNFRDSISKAELLTNGNSGIFYVPSSPTEWKQASINMSSGFQNLTHQDDVRIRFDYISSAVSNNLYIDDLWFSGTVGIAEIPESGAAMVIYPNPTNDVFTVEHALANPAAATLTISDALGRMVLVKDLGVAASGSVKIDARTLSLAPGTYSVVLRSSEGLAVQRLTIN